MKREVIYLCSKAGIVETYESKEAAFKKLGFSFIKNSIGFEFDIPNRRLYQSSCERVFFGNKPSGIAGKTNQKAYADICGDGFLKRYSDFVLRNEYGENLTIIEFAELAIKQRKEWDDRRYIRRSLDTWNGEGPVPGTGKFRSYGSFWRHPKTFAALRTAAEFLDENEVPVRAKRTAGHIPTTRDDRVRSDYRIKSWKKYRKTQYKESA